jgi:gliding-associated putative ABC transporter substrate-binding component GldG
MNTKLQQTGSNVAEVLIVIAILALVNWLGYKFFRRLDLTQNKQYTISESTKKVLGALDDPVNVTVYMSGDLPPQMTSVRRTVKDTMEEFNVYGRGKFRVRYVDPKDDQKVKDKAENEGIQKVQVQVVEHDEASVKDIYFGAVLNYADKSETITTGELAAQDSLEYSLTSRILRLTMPKKPRIGVFEGSFVASQQQQAPTYQAVQQLLTNQQGLYEVVRIDPKTDRVLPDDLNAVLLLGTFGLGDELKYSIDQYLLKGGQVMVAIDPMMDLRQMQGGLAQAYPSLPTYETELEKYGVRLEKKLVGEADVANSARAPIRQGPFQVLVQYPLWPKIGPKGFNQKIAAVARLESFVMPFCCPLFPVDQPGVEYQPLMHSTPAAFVYSSPFNLDPHQEWAFVRTKSETKGPFNLGVLLTGKFPTAFPDGPPQVTPPPPDESAEGVTPPAAPQFDAKDQVKTGIAEGRLLVISSAAAVSDEYMQQFQENALFLANAVDMLAFGDDLLGIRSTPVTQRPLKTLNEWQKQLYRWANVLGIPVLLCLYGLGVYAMKRKRRAALQAKYGGAA